MKTMSIKELSLELGVSQNTIRNWELVLGLDIKRNELSYRMYDKNVQLIFAEVKDFLKDGKSLKDIKNKLLNKIQAYNNPLDVNKEEYIETEYETVPEPSDKYPEFIKKEDLAYIFQGLAEEMKKYINSMFESNRKVLYLEDNDKRKDRKISELEAEIKQLRIQLEQKENDLQEACKPWYHKIL